MAICGDFHSPVAQARGDIGHSEIKFAVVSQGLHRHVEQRHHRILSRTRHLPGKQSEIERRPGRRGAVTSDTGTQQKAIALRDRGGEFPDSPEIEQEPGVASRYCTGSWQNWDRSA